MTTPRKVARKIRVVEEEVRTRVEEGVQAQVVSRWDRLKKYAPAAASLGIALAALAVIAILLS